MAFNPKFDRNVMGKFNELSNIMALRGGSNAFFLEDEMNEMQWVQNHQRALLTQTIAKSGCINYGSGSDKFGTIESLGTSNPNCFLLNGMLTNLKGYLTNVDSTDGTGIIIRLPEPNSVKGDIRYDFVYLEFWFEELKEFDKVRTYGYVKNEPLDYDIIDNRGNFETARRIQLRYDIRVASNVNPLFEDGFIDRDGNYNYDIKCQANGQEPIPHSYFVPHERDEGLYLYEGEVINNIPQLRTIDNHSYAIPLFLVKRRNSAGYDEYYNPDGGTNYEDDTSNSGRPDGQFPNVIYPTDIIDVRKPSRFGEKHFADLYVTRNEFYKFKTEIILNIQNNLDSLLDEFGQFKDYVDLRFYQTEQNCLAHYNDLNLIVNTLQEQHNNDINSLYTFINGKINDVNGDISALQSALSALEYYTQYNIDKINLDLENILRTLNETYAWVDDHERRIRTIEIILKDIGFENPKDVLKYRIEMERRGAVATGGDVNVSTGIITSIGALIQGVYETVNDYFCTTVIEEENTAGKFGDMWHEKADGNYLIKNTGASGYKLKSFAFKLSGSPNSTKVRSGFNTFNGDVGVTIPQALATNDIVIITPLNANKAVVGEYYMINNVSNFVIKNTGATNVQFQWCIINTSTLLNTQLVTANFTPAMWNAGLSYSSCPVTGPFGSANGYDVLLGVPTVPTVMGTVGDLFILKQQDGFAIRYTDKSTFSIKCLVFKEVNVTTQIEI